MKRKDGYYKVKHPNLGWIIAEWEGTGDWYITGCSTCFVDSDFEEIGEMIII